MRLCILGRSSSCSACDIFGPKSRVVSRRTEHSLDSNILFVDLASTSRMESRAFFKLFGADSLSTPPGMIWVKAEDGNANA